MFVITIASPISEKHEIIFPGFSGHAEVKGEEVTSCGVDYICLLGRYPILIGDTYGGYLPHIVTQREDYPAYIRSYSGPSTWHLMTVITTSRDGLYRTCDEELCCFG